MRPCEVFKSATKWTIEEVMPTKRELTEVVKLRNLVKEKDELLMQSAIKIEALTGVMDEAIYRNVEAKQLCTKRQQQSNHA